MIVLRLILCCLLAQASWASCNATIRRQLLDRVAYRQSRVNQGQLYDWLYRLLGHIFAHRHRTTVLFDRAGGSFNNYAPTVIQRRAGRDTIDLAFELYAEDVGLANEDINYLVMSRTLGFFLRAFDDALHYKYAKYLIGTQMDSEEEFRALLRHLEGRDYAYVTIVRLVNETRGRIYQLRSQSSAIYPHREQHLVAVLEKPIAEPPSRAEVSRDVRPYSRTVCPVKKCRLHANSLKEEIVLTRFRAREYQTAVRDLLDTFCNLNRLVDYVYYPLEPAEYWWQLEEQLSQELDGIDVIFGNLLAPPNFTELFDVVCVFKQNSYYFADLLEELKPNVGALLEPFDASIWLSFLGVAGLCACFLLMTSCLRARRLLRESGRVFDICAVLFEQGARLPGHGGLRAVFAMWIVFAFLCGLFYNAAFKTSLMNAEHGTNYRTLGELELDDADVLGGPEAVKEFLNDTGNEVLLGLYRRYEIIAADEIIERLLDHDVTAALSKLQIDNVARGLMREPDIDLYYIEEPIVTFPLLLYLRKGHPFVSHLQRLAIDNAATGAMDYANYSEYDLDPPYSSSSYIGLNQFVVAVYVLLIGLSAAGLLLLGEIYHSARKKKKIEGQLAAKKSSDTKER